MILLEPGNRILGETVAAQIKPAEQPVPEEGEEKGKREPIDVRLCDFDDVTYRVVIDAKNRNLMTVSMNLPCYREIENNGAKDALQKHYKNLVVAPEAGFDVSVQIDFDSLGYKEDELINKLQMLKPNVLGGVFEYYFGALLDGKPQSSPFKFSLRSDTQVFFFPKSDRVTVIFSLDFQDKVDTAIAKVFMQEFVDARKRLGAAPPCGFGVQPPLELKEFNITEPGKNLGYISFAVMKSHLEGGRKEKVIAVLQVFRNYLQYHIKCSKSYFHSRMRARVVSLLQILNRAKYEKADKKEMKTIQGKTFIRQS
jgi:actin related protein 2/3 complex subunit 2